MRSLKISTYPNVPQFNIPRIISNLENLRELWIEAPSAPKISTFQPTDLSMPVVVTPPIVASDLRAEMTGALPVKLRKVTIGGRGFSKIDDTILNVSSVGLNKLDEYNNKLFFEQGLQSRSLHFALFNTSLSKVPDLLFQHLGKVQNVSLELDPNNLALSSIPNPNSARRPFMAEKVFLTNMKISGNSLSCDCGVG